MVHLLLLTALAVHSAVLAAPVPKEALSETSAMAYLARYGYMAANMTNKNSAIRSEEVLQTAVKQFQAFAGLNVTGRLDRDTVAVMRMPRCGLQDVAPHEASSRSRRYALAGSRWRKQHLTYSINSYPARLPREVVDYEVARAFSVWSGYVDLQFFRVHYGQAADINILFASGEHGDGNPFDGPGNTLAHAFFPVYGGDVHFDNSEPWTSKSYSGTNFFQTAAHEIGHALGLAHSEVPAALMAPFYRGYQPHFRLHKDDIAAIRTLYGRYYYGSLRAIATSNQPATTTTTTQIDLSLEWRAVTVP